MVKVVITSSYFLELGIKHNWLISVTPYDQFSSGLQEEIENFLYERFNLCSLESSL